MNHFHVTSYSEDGTRVLSTVIRPDRQSAERLASQTSGPGPVQVQGCTERRHLVKPPAWAT